MLLTHQGKMKNKATAIININGWLHLILMVTRLQYKFNVKDNVICIYHMHLVPSLCTLIYRYEKKILNLVSVKIWSMYIINVCKICVEIFHIILRKCKLASLSPYPVHRQCLLPHVIFTIKSASYV